MPSERATRIAAAELAVDLFELAQAARVDLRHSAVRDRVLDAVRRALLADVVEVPRRTLPDPWRPAPGVEHRVSFAWWPLRDGEPLFSGPPRFWPSGRSTNRCFPDSDAGFTTIVVVWPTDSHGKLEKDRLIARDVHVRLWVMGPRIHDYLTRVDESFPFALHDIRMRWAGEGEFNGRGKKRIAVEPGTVMASPCADHVLKLCCGHGAFRDLSDRILAEAGEIGAGLDALAAKAAVISGG